MISGIPATTSACFSSSFGVKYTFDYFDVALISLNNYIKDDKHYRRSYFVNNSFYNNVYDCNAQNKYELLCREVGEWEHFENFNKLKNF